jgi:hypothetical protein
VCVVVVVAVVVAGVRKYNAGHEMFLDGKSAVFVVVVRLDVDLQESERQLRYWLRFIKGRMASKPEDGSRPAVMVIGSHRDAAGEDFAAQEDGAEWTSEWGSDLLQSVSRLFACV